VPRPVEPEDLLALRTIADVQLAPGGQRVAYTLTEIDAAADDYRSAIWVVPASGGEPRRLTHGSRRDSAPRWSPDGRWLAFLSDRDGGAPQLYLLPADGGEARKVTALEGGAGPAAWAPDGTRLAFAARGPLETPPADREARARWAERPRVITRAAYKDDGAGYQLDTRSHLFVVRVADGEVRRVTDAVGDDRTPAWAPDGRRLVFSRTRAGAADYQVSDLWVVDLDGGAPRQLTVDVGRAASPTWSPDGATIACYGTDEQQPGYGDPIYRVWLVPAAGGPARRLTAGWDRGAFLVPPPAVNPGPAWAPDGGSVTFVAADRGNVHVVRGAVADGSVRPVVGGGRQLWWLHAAAGRLAFVASAPTEPGDVWVAAWDGSDERRLTRVNAGLLDGLALPRVERRAFASPHGGTLDGWVVHPVTTGGTGRPEGRRPDASRRSENRRPVPLLVFLHGGPHAFAGNVFQHGAFYWYVLAARGWAVLALNAHGSGSYGQAFAHALRGRWGEYDLPEQLAAADALVADGLADPERLAVAGYSYGGYMTAWTIAHTDRFKAAVVGAPVTNLESFHGTSDIGPWFGLFEMKGDLVGHRETYRRLSPVTYVDRITTPTLVLHGEADDRCPIGQGEELYAGLVAVGKVPAEFVRYPGASHLFVGTGRPSHRVDYTRRIVAWVTRFTLSPAGSSPLSPGGGEGRGEGVTR